MPPSSMISPPDTPRPLLSPRIIGVFLAVLAVAMLATVAVNMWLRCGSRLMWPPLQDDAYYYYVVAHNFAHERGLTMDGVLTTNGFQPLWFLIVLPFFALAPQRTDGPIIAVQCLSILLFAVTVACLYFTALRLGVRRELAVAAALGALFAPFVAHTCGMEGVITLPLLVLALRWMMLRPELLTPGGAPPRAADCLILGTLLALLMLARLDSVFAILTALAMLAFGRLGLAASWKVRSARLVRDGALVCLPLGLLVGPYLLWNLLTTGHLVPVSGALKSTFPHAVFQMRWLREFPHWFALLVPMLVWLPIAAVRPRHFPGTAAIGRALLPAVIGSLLHATYTLFFCKWAVHGWHFAFYIPPALLCGAQLVQWLIDAGARSAGLRIFIARAAVLAAVAIIFASVFVSVRKVLGENEFRASAYDAATWARQNTPPTTLFAMSDCGVFTYYSQRDCINLDGVINSWGFQDILASGKLNEYFAQRGVAYLVSHWVPLALAEHAALERAFPARLFADCQSTIFVERRDEVYRSRPYQAGDGPGFLAVWRLRH